MRLKLNQGAADFRLCRQNARGPDIGRWVTDNRQMHRPWHRPKFASNMVPAPARLTNRGSPEFVKQPPFILSICGKHQVDRFARSGITHLLSLEDPGILKATPAWFSGPHVQLHLHDLDAPGNRAGLEGVPPTLEHVRSILHMGEACLSAAATTGPDATRVHLLVHCYAGISRSTAAAYAIATQSMGVEHAEQALAFVLQTRPEAFPNALIVRHADRLLGGKGRLIAALQPLRNQFGRALDD